MKGIRKGFVWFLLLNKRLFLKFSFWVVLAMVPCLVLGMQLAAKEDSGILTIYLCKEDPKDPMADMMIAKLMEKKSIVQFHTDLSIEEAMDAVIRGEADGVWIFQKDLQENMSASSESRKLKPVVRAIEREDYVALIMAREKLYSVLYPYYNYAIYEEYTRNAAGEEHEIGAEELQKAYDDYIMPGELFEMTYLDGGKVEVEDTSYLLTPIRGLLALWFILCGLAGSLYYLQDKKRGMFDYMQGTHQLLFSFVYLGIILITAGVVMLIAIEFSGLAVNFFREVLSLVMLLLTTVGFCSLLRLLCGSMERLGSCIPVLLLLMLVFCPVFISIKQLRWLQFMQPPYFYLKSIHGMSYYKDMAIYIVVVYGACALVYHIKRMMHHE